MIKIDFEKIKKFLCINEIKIYLLFSLICFLGGIYSLNMELKSLKYNLQAQQSLINDLRDWNHSIERQLHETKKLLKEQCMDK